MKKQITVTGTGDSLFTARFPEEYKKGGMKAVAEWIGGCDVRLTNLETNLSELDSFAGAYSGGTWLNTKSEYFEDLQKFGFNFYGTANNHVMDYSFAGLLSTIEVLDRNHQAHAGTGRSLEEAGAPAILESNGMKTAVFAVDASLNDVSRAGSATHEIKARPGVNFLRNKIAYKITKEEMDSLKKIADKTGINFSRNLSINTGYATPDPEGVFVFGKHTFTLDQDSPSTFCHPGDLKRLIGGIREAKKTCDYVFILVHCHDDDRKEHVNPPEYLTEFCHACIDAGVSAVFGGGCHCLRGIELYRGLPIFYSLGDFIYQGLAVEYLPADFMEKYGIDIFSTAKEALWARSRGGKVGLHCSKDNYQTLLPKLTFEDGKLTGFALLPLYLNFHRKDEYNGLPEKAEGAEAEEILAMINRLSKPFGTQFRLADGQIVFA